MEIEMRFFANFRDAVGQKTVTREFDGATVGDLLQDLAAEYPEMDLFEDDGSLRDFLTIMKGGKDIAHQEGLDTPLEDGDTVSVFPPVAGGSGRKDQSRTEPPSRAQQQ
jgi:molybdopterin synthase sulfur carrier subunit